MGKFSAALILVSVFAWLGPMCAQHPATVAPFVVPDKPATPIAVPEPAHVTLATYRMKKMFAATSSGYRIYVIRANQATVPAVALQTGLAIRINGTVVEQTVSAIPQTLAPGSASYAGLSVSRARIDEILSGPAAPGTGLEWTIAYRLEGEAPDAKRCFVLRALPRRREPEGIFWRALGESQECGQQGEAVTESRVMTR